MKRILGAAVGVCLLAGSQAIAQTPEKKTVETTTKQTGSGATLRPETQSVSGTVTKYEAGRTIKLAGPGDQSYSFDLGENVRVDGAIVVGQMATVKYNKATDGKETVAVISETNALTAAEAPKMHSDSTMTDSGQAASGKTKSEVLIGTVKAYEAGQSIKVTGPDDREYSFDLTGMDAPKTAVTVGERVQVTFTKSDGGSKATSIVASPHKG